MIYVKKMHRVCCVLLSCSLIVVTSFCSPATARAGAGDVYVEHVKDAFLDTDIFGGYSLNDFGFYVGGNGLYEDTKQIIRTWLKEKYITGVPVKETKYSDGKTTVEVDGAVYDALYDKLKGLIELHGEYTVLSPNYNGTSYVNAFMGKEITPDAYFKSVQLFSAPDVMYVKSKEFNTVLRYPLNNTYFYLDGYGKVIPYGSKGPVSQICYSQFTTSGYGIGLYFMSSTYTKYTLAQHQIVIGTQPIKVFNSAVALSHYTSGTMPFYTATRFDKKPIPRPIDKDVLLKNDWDQINNDMLVQIRNAIQNAGDNISSDDLQGIIDGLDKKLQETLDMIQGGIEENNKTLEEILDSITATGNSQSSWLSKIYALLTEKLSVDNVVGSDKAVLDSILKEMEKSNASLNKVLTKLDKLISVADSDGGGGGFIALLIAKFGDTADVAKTKFPTSIPWDLALVFGKLFHAPEVPVFEFPLVLSRFGINETFRMDLEKFEPLSKASRGVLTLTFIMFLLILTRKMFMKGGDDQ